MTVAAATVLAKASVLASGTALANGAVLAKATVSDNNVTPGVLGFIVVAAMGIALFFLLRSMNRHLRKVPPAPPEEDADTPAPSAAHAGSAGTAHAGPAGGAKDRSSGRR